MPRTSSAWRTFKLLLAACVCVGLTAEAVARLALDRISRVQRRTVDELAQASAIRHHAGGRRQLLVVGNSMLDEGVQFQRLAEALTPSWDAHRVVVEQTFFYDWYYGLQKLFDDGAEPDVVAVALSPLQWIDSRWRGEYSAQYLMRTADVPSAARALGLHPTEATSVALARFSKFWGTRAEIRNFVFGHMVPGLGDLMSLSAVVDQRVLTDEGVEHTAAERVRAMDALVRSHQAQFLVLVIPVFDPGDGSNGLVKAASAAGIRSIRPVASGDYGRDLYRDAGFHLNSRGAEEFTSRLIPVLNDELDSMAGQDGPRARLNR
ncbi:MAG TPA: hypothetical protein VJP86_17155 [Vicinamibacterales bacterium]|nr:hypothetical protein [Vicinamibacterales bacterium]